MRRTRRLLQTRLGTEGARTPGVANPEDQMTDRPDARLVGFVLDAPNPRELAAFYRELVGWTAYDQDDTWVRLGPADDSRPGLSIQLEPNYRAPTWPGVTDAPQMRPTSTFWSTTWRRHRSSLSHSAPDKRSGSRSSACG